ncbi:hypothetical protein CRG98_023104 [Punica granatum]|uniref:Reverse transcriptase Ty1/copia-type domain-containing protein n=1 Tax=Punica granatum TaxID=22663 RepID=A0A2I0JLR0_PUNGR|nr:hypothetical protein CRG98_023104 [Punica granatum]
MDSIVILSLYVDHLLVTGDNKVQVEKLKGDLQKVFEMTDLGDMSYFLGMKVQQKKNEAFICQKKYLREILKKFKMEECKSALTPMNLKEKLKKDDGSDATDASRYRSLIGCLMYLTATRPNILLVVSVLSRYLSCASENHMVAAKRVVRYLKGTPSFGVKFCKSDQFKLHGYIDSDWAGSIDDISSGYCLSFGSTCFSWSSKKQDIVAQSIAEAKLIAATTAANQAVWLRKLMNDLGFGVEEATTSYVDNQAAIAVSQNLVFHGKTKHFKVKYFYLREVQHEGKVKLQHCSSEDQLADMFTKAFSVGQFNHLRQNIGVCISS